VNEFNLVLDENMLPARYNQDIINKFFKLIAEEDSPDHGLDFQSFIYYDFALRLYGIQNTTRIWYLNPGEFIKVINNPLFNTNMMGEIYAIPMTNFTQVSLFFY
jgi:hypothetical protein